MPAWRLHESKQAYRGLGLDPKQRTDNDDGKSIISLILMPGRLHTSSASQDHCLAKTRRAKKKRARNKEEERDSEAWTEKGRNKRRTRKYQAQTMPSPLSLMLSVITVSLSPDLPEAGRQAGSLRLFSAMGMRCVCDPVTSHKTQTKPGHSQPARGYMQSIHTRGKGLRVRPIHLFVHPFLCFRRASPPGADTYLPVSGGPLPVGLCAQIQ
ncbi:hypothetical protein IWX90DRAFT_414888 [Phyllosticta citrichinensis]|uniref:Uncharacterized protein n=1 Tax=Phyllosticta citrichinensis TaxID=1130410 RepID=A0ABR1XTG8_9PEZI